MKKCYYILLLLLMCGCATVEDKNGIEYTNFTIHLDSTDLNEFAKKSNVSFEQLKIRNDGGGATYNPFTGEITIQGYVVGSDIRDLIAGGGMYVMVSPNPASYVPTIEVFAHSKPSYHKVLIEQITPFHFKCDIICDEKIIGHFENATSYGKEQIPESLLQKTGTYLAVCTLNDKLQLTATFMVIKN